MSKQGGLRVLFVGLYGQFSLLPLRCLLDANVKPVAVLLPQRDDGGAETEIVRLCREANIPLLFVGRVGGKTAVSQISSLAPDIAVVSCFSQIIPPHVLAIPRFGFLNLHPSLLPHHRGPDPLFWTFHAGKLETGVTVHRLDAGLDTGAIVAQQPLTLPDGCRYEEAEAICAQAGGGLLVELLVQLANKANEEHGASFPLVTVPQGSGGSYESFPTMLDFGLDVGESAGRAFRFMRGTAGWGYPYRLEAKGQVWWLKTAVSYLPDANDRPVGTVALDGETAVVQFDVGQLTATLATV